MEKLRTFIAIELPDKLKKRLKMLQEELKKNSGNASKISWARPETIHLTLKFIGDIDGGKAQEITEGLKKAAENVKAFNIAVQGVGGFPDLKNPRVLWVGIEEGAELKTLYENIEERMEALGFEREKRGFHPHLTLCRIKNPQDGKRLSEGLKNIKTGGTVNFPAESIVFFKSELGLNGAIHTPLKQIDLKS
ncbi:MAG: RNA 2',3'-cyclic phosphodiesterase [Deltaproteobacteria bacterium]|nr:RNA 2',3'-cyclic phosphodiesterase [Deltaproteobacteria bacterium]